MGSPAGQPVVHIDDDYRNCQKGNLHIGLIERPLKPKKPRKRRVTIENLIEAVKVERFREWLYYCKRNHSENTVDQYARVIKGFVTFLTPRDGKSVDPANLTVPDIERYLDWLLRGHGRNTGNSSLSVLKSFFTWQTKRYNTPNIGAEVPFLRPEPPKQRVLTDAEYHAVLNVAKPLEKDAIQFLGHTGLRRGEFMRLTWANISNDLSFIRFTGKGQKERIVPLSAVAQNILKKSADRSAPIPFIARYGGSASMLDRFCQRLAERAGIPRFGPHAVRHYFCTRMVKANVSLKKISKMLGHSSLAITEHVYCHLLPEDLIGLTDVLTD